MCVYTYIYIYIYTPTGEHQVCFIGRGDPVLRLPTNRGRGNLLFCILGLRHEAYLDLRKNR